MCMLESALGFRDIRSYHIHGFVTDWLAANATLLLPCLATKTPFLVSL